MALVVGASGVHPAQVGVVGSPSALGEFVNRAQQQSCVRARQRRRGRFSIVRFDHRRGGAGCLWRAVPPVHSNQRCGAGDAAAIYRSIRCG